MTDTLLQKLEEKTVNLLTEFEHIRNELNQLRQENSALKAEKGNYTKKLQGLISLLETLDITDNLVTMEPPVSMYDRNEAAVS
jgi:FtsZ-binding cell division protein ZapB